MDPNANLAEQERIILRYPVRQGDWARLRDLRIALNHWLQMGGFEPDWSKAPNARVFFGR